MRKTASLLGATAMLVAAGLIHGSVSAQIHDAGTLLKLGNDNWNRNCVVSAMNYYALLQRFPGWLKGDEAEARSRIDRCRRGYKGTAGINGKADEYNRPIPTPKEPPAPPFSVVMADVVARPLTIVGEGSAATPRVRACRAYAETAVAQSRMLAAPECRAIRPHKASSYEFHYNWCTQRGTPEAAQAYANDRAQAVNSCQLRW